MSKQRTKGQRDHEPAPQLTYQLVEGMLSQLQEQSKLGQLSTDQVENWKQIWRRFLELE